MIHYTKQKQVNQFWMKAIMLVLVGVLGLKSTQAQIKVGNNPNQIEKSSLLELESETEGLLLPRLSDTVAINALNPPSGMLIYLKKGPRIGVYIRKNGGWDFLMGASNTIATANAGNLSGAALAANVLSSSLFR